MEGVAAYPLHWPDGWPRSRVQQRARFDCTFAQARTHLMQELGRIGARYATLSTNVELRLDGLPYANKPEPLDPGVAVYFLREGKSMTFACDRWDRVRDNIRAIAKTLEALRGIERWGASDMMERAFSAFESLPPPKTCWQVLGLEPGASADAIRAAHRRLAKVHHPDAGGSHAAMAEINAAVIEAMKGAAQ